MHEVGALKKRLVASERERKQSLAQAAAENRALQLQLQVRDDSTILSKLLTVQMHTDCLCLAGTALANKQHATSCDYSSAGASWDHSNLVSC